MIDTSELNIRECRILLIRIDAQLIDMLDAYPAFRTSAQKLHIVELRHERDRLRLLIASKALRSDRMLEYRSRRRDR